MGSIARMNRANRYIEEFEADYVRGSTLSLGKTYTLVRSGLEQEEGNCEQVFMCHVFREVNGNGTDHRMYEPMPVFDPEWDRGEDMIERVAAHLGISKDEAKARLEKAELL